MSRYAQTATTKFSTRFMKRRLRVIPRTGLLTLGLWFTWVAMFTGTRVNHVNHVNHRLVYIPQSLPR
jgi:hypothetical protein